MSEEEFGTYLSHHDPRNFTDTRTLNSIRERPKLQITMDCKFGVSHHARTMLLISNERKNSGLHTARAERQLAKKKARQF